MKLSEARNIIIREILDTKYFEDHIEDKYGVKLDLYDNGDHLVLSSIVVPNDERGIGIGTKVMEELEDYADEVQLPVYLTPAVDFGASSKARLEKFYKRFNFQKKPRSDFKSRNTMVRYPFEKA